MDFKKLIPWNWFKKEEEGAGMVPTRQREARRNATRRDESISLAPLHMELDRWLDAALRNMGVPSLADDGSMRGVGLILKPNLDIAATENEYIIRMELPGLEPSDVSLELQDDTLTISGEKRQDQESEDADFYRVERAYGAFQRVLSLPEDADRDRLEAKLSNGVLTIRVPRTQTARPSAKIIGVSQAA
jgi:HSP20 family protein